MSIKVAMPFLMAKKRNLRISVKITFEVKANGIAVSVMTNLDGTRNVSYTGKKGANGVCSEADAAKTMAKPQTKSTTTPPKNMTSYCKGEAVGQFNTKPMYIETGKAFATSTGYAIKGTGDLGNQGKKAFQCNFDQNGKLQNFQSLVNEGSL
ncbi:hypothetical protein [Deefgea sp. CFH1-16]|uniref:hypothetical protein n=1 Tax=Deefgea sp. CFH1-16 TaxID=2675457 RepID=UPI0019402305|nr:hypothetical protein [Deefgea sp. CFH1-16]